MTVPGRFAAVRQALGGETRASGAELVRATRRRFGRALVIAFFISAMCNLAGLLVPLYSMALYNIVLNTRNTNTLLWLSGGLAFGMAVYAALEYVRAILYDTMAERGARELSLPALLAANRAADDKGSVASGEVIRDLAELRNFVSGNAVTIPLDLMWSPIFLAALFIMHWAYGAFALLCMLLLTGLSVGADLLTRRTYEQANNETLHSFAEISNALRNAEAVEGLGMLPALTRRWRASQDLMLERLWRATTTGKIFAAATKASRILMTGGMVCLGLVLTINGEASGGSMVATNLILARLLLPFEQLMSSLRSWVAASAAWRRLASCLSEERSRRGTIPLPCPSGTVVVDRLVYIPPHIDLPVLRGVSFRIEAGEVLGVIGPSGAGKSTLARLVVGALEPTAGGVWLDGNSTWHWERGDFGNHVGYMPQATMLLEGTLAENIARLRDVDQREIVAVSRQVGIHDAIMRLPNGYATTISEAGFVLSGGQRQRLALARALFGKPKLLVLDEPNSNLDEEGEAVLLACIGAARNAGTSVLMIAHRPSIVTLADKLLVLKDGLVDRFGARQAVLRALSSPPLHLLHGPEAGAAPALSAAR
jgi:ATP-binding cassette, subfamily C, type I secretion system permease/ATPase